MSKGSDKRPHSTRKYGSGYDGIDWGAKPKAGPALTLLTAEEARDCYRRDAATPQPNSENT